MTTVWISIDNSHDQMSQPLWREYIKEIDRAVTVHAIGDKAIMVHSLPTSEYMGCHWCLQISDDFLMSNLQNKLKDIAQRFNQSHVTWNECPNTKKLVGVIDVLETVG